MSEIYVISRTNFSLLLFEINVSNGMAAFEIIMNCYTADWSGASLMTGPLLIELLHICGASSSAPSL